MKENPLRSLPGIPYLLGMLVLTAVAIWMFVAGLGPDPDNGVASGWLDCSCDCSIGGAS